VDDITLHLTKRAHENYIQFKTYSSFDCEPQIPLREHTITQLRTVQRVFTKVSAQSHAPKGYNRETAHSLPTTSNIPFATGRAPSAKFSRVQSAPFVPHPMIQHLRSAGGRRVSAPNVPAVALALGRRRCGFDNGARLRDWTAASWRRHAGRTRTTCPISTHGSTWPTRSWRGSQASRCLRRGPVGGRPEGGERR
jgi:hypothetical protein